MSTRHLFKSSLGAMALILSMGATQAQSAHPAHPPHPHDMGKMMTHHVSRMAESIGASAEQKAKLLAIAKATQADIKPLHEQARAGREQGRALLSAVTLDAAAIEQHRAAQSQIHDAISRRMTQSMIDSAMALTPEQRVKWAGLMKSRHGEMGEMGKMGGRGDMPRRPMHDMPAKN
ncbi:MAG: periplasmic heavy metal sensor [Cytophagales bacterium]|nr:periplasmic heavy metal sensor [Cytophagales bacterium]